MTEPNKKIYFTNLDGLRFFCFLSVFLFHSFHTTNPNISNSSLYLFCKQYLFGNGFLGVNFFFVLSGFLITYLLIEEQRVTSKIDVPKFWLRRILRIWPLYFACVFIGFVVFPLAKKISGGLPSESANIWYYLTFTNNFDYINKGLPDAPGLGVLWSIAIEEQFYLVWPLLLSLVPLKKYWIVFLGIIAGSIAFRAWYDIPILHEMHTFSCIGDMATGALGAWLWLQNEKFRCRIEKMPRLLIICLYAVFFFIFLFRDEFLLNYYLLRVIERWLLAVIIILIILEQCFANNSFYKMGNFQKVSELGIVTYGLYCIHFIIISATVGIMGKLNLHQYTWQVVFLHTLVALVITIIISKLSYRYFEKPFLKLKEKFSFIK